MFSYVCNQKRKMFIRRNSFECAIGFCISIFLNQNRRKIEIAIFIRNRWLDSQKQNVTCARSNSWKIQYGTCWRLISHKTSAIITTTFIESDVIYLKWMRQLSKAGEYLIIKRFYHILLCMLAPLPVDKRSISEASSWKSVLNRKWLHYSMTNRFAFIKHIMNARTLTDAHQFIAFA